MLHFGEKVGVNHGYFVDDEVGAFAPLLGDVASGSQLDRSLKVELTAADAGEAVHSHAAYLTRRHA